MRKVKFLAVLAMVVLLVGCAGIEEKWGELTPDQKARIVIDDLQGQLDNAFNQCLALVVAKPELRDKWKTQINPAFDLANKALGSVIAIGKTKPLTPEFVYAQVQTQITNALNFAIQIGAIKP